MLYERAVYIKISPSSFISYLTNTFTKFVHRLHRKILRDLHLCAFFVNCICLECIVVILRVFVVSYVYLFYLICICFTLYVFVVPYVYLLYYVCIAVLTLDAGLLARSQYPESPATGHLDTGFS